MAASDSACTDLLRAHVLDAGNVATFRWLANEAGVGSDRAKRVMAGFLEAHEAKLTATYCVSGLLRSPAGGSPPTFAVRVVAADKLESCRAEFEEQPSVHVYAVASKGSTLSDEALWSTDLSQRRSLFRSEADRGHDFRANRLSAVKAEGITLGKGRVIPQALPEEPKVARTSSQPTAEPAAPGKKAASSGASSSSKKASVKRSASDPSTASKARPGGRPSGKLNSFFGKAAPKAARGKQEKKKEEKEEPKVKEEDDDEEEGEEEADEALEEEEEGAAFGDDDGDSAEAEPAKPASTTPAGGDDGPEPAAEAAPAGKKVASKSRQPERKGRRGKKRMRRKSRVDDDEDDGDEVGYNDVAAIATRKEMEEEGEEEGDGPRLDMRTEKELEAERARKREEREREQRAGPSAGERFFGAAKSGGGSGKRTKRVLKSSTYIDDQGYIRTKEEWVEQTDDEADGGDSQDATPATAPAGSEPDETRAAGDSPQKRARKEPAKAKAKGKGTAKGKGKASPPKAKATAQQSMFSFFKRG